jgi:hypothetical protein
VLRNFADSATNPSADPDLEGTEVENFFRQLWEVPCSSLSRSSYIPLNLFWIRPKLWEAKHFEAQDLFPVKVGDVWSSKPKKLTFVKLVWQLGVHISFHQVLLEGIAGRGGRGRGRKRRGVGGGGSRG